MAAARYAIHGLTVDSELPLDGSLKDQPAAGGDPDYRIVLGEPVEVPFTAPPGRLLGQLHLDDFGYWAAEEPGEDGVWALRYAGVCDVRLDRERRLISVHPAASGKPELITMVVSGSVLAHALTAEDRLVLHASAVAVEEGAIAIVGPSGSGKSTLGALLCAAGASLVTDDALRVEPAGSGLRCYPGNTVLRLREKVAPLAGEIAGDVAATADGRTSVRPERVLSEPTRVLALLIPSSPAGATGIALTRLDGVDGLVELLRYPRLPAWRDPAIIGRMFATTAEAAEAVPVARIEIPAQIPLRPEFGAQLLDAVRDAA